MKSKVLSVFIVFIFQAFCLFALEAQPNSSETAPKSKQSVVPMRPTLPLKLALRTAVSAEMKAKELNMSVAIVILDEAQNIKLEYVMDGQTTNSLKWARAKALSAFEFKRPTQKGEFKVWNIADQTMVLGVPGGYPLIHEDIIVGAVGISGTRGSEDDIIANTAVEEFNKLYNQQ